MATTGKVIQCNAAVCWAHNEPLTIEKIEVDPPQGKEVRIRMVATSLCHSDVHALAGMVLPGVYNRQLPVVLGHEGAGVVESVGPDVTSVKQGDHVIPLFGTFCGECSVCLLGKSNFCPQLSSTKFSGVMSDGTSRMRVRGQTLYHFLGTSTFSEYTVVHEYNVAKIDQKADLRKVGVVGCCIPTGVGAALNSAGVTPGSSCAVWGLGAVGLSIVLGCKLAGATTIVGVDICPEKEEIAKRFGCTHFINPKTLTIPIAEHVAKEFNGGIDFTFESIGNAKVMKDAFDSAHRLWGLCTIVGIEDEKNDIAVNAVGILLGKKLQGSIFGGYRFRNDVPKLVDDVLAGKIRCEDFISEKLELKDVNRALELMKTGKGIRSMMLF